jgi:hypothetical protein
MILSVDIPLLPIPHKSTWLLDDLVWIEKANTEDRFLVLGKESNFTRFFCKTNEKTQISFYLVNFIQLLGSIKDVSLLTLWYNDYRKSGPFLTKAHNFLSIQTSTEINDLTDSLIENYHQLSVTHSGINLSFDFPKYFEGYLKLEEKSTAKSAVKLFFLAKDISIVYIGLYNNSGFVLTQYFTIIESLLKKMVKENSIERNCNNCKTTLGKVPLPLYKLLEIHFVNKGYDLENKNIKASIKAIKQLYKGQRSGFVHGNSYYNEIEESRKLMDKLNRDSYSFLDDLENTGGKASWLINIQILAQSLLLDQLRIEIE